MIRDRFACALLFTLAACGGAAEEMPKPLEHTVEDMHIAQVPIEQKQAVIQAKQDYDVAMMEKAKAEADLADLDVKISICGNEAAAAGLAEKSARTEKEAAYRTADMTRHNNADRELHTAQLGKQAADAKVAFLKAKRDYMRRRVRFNTFDLYFKEAKWQLEKAKVAQAHNIRPPGFAMVAFDDQLRLRSEAAQREKTKADREQQRAEERRREWNARDRAWNAAKPRLGQMPAPTTTSTDTTGVITPAPSQ